MSIYMLRFQGLVKIGFTDDLPTRLTTIMSTIPGVVTFIGHMPGGREVESYLHQRFDAYRFNGEWFVEAEPIKQFAELLLDPEKPKRPVDTAPSRRSSSKAEVAALSKRVREFAAVRWPDMGHVDRLSALTLTLDWKRSRAKGLYYADHRLRLHASEVQELEGLMALDRTGTRGE